MDARIAKSVLILEDEPLIALDHDEIVERAGFTQVTIFSTCTAANEWLQFNNPTVALLDVRLRDGPCAAVAQLLRNKGIPFVVCSGSSQEDADPAFRSGVWVSKPCIPDDLIAALTQAKSKVADQSIGGLNGEPQNETHAGTLGFGELRPIQSNRGGNVQ